MAPTVWTPMEGTVNILLPASQSYWDQAIYISYYSKPTYPDSDSDVIQWPDPELYHFFLAWKITLKRHNGLPTDSSQNFKALYDERKRLLISRARLQDTPKFVPKVPYKRQDISSVTNAEWVSWVIR